MNIINELESTPPQELNVLSSGDLRVDLLNRKVSYKTSTVTLPPLSFQLLTKLMLAWPNSVSQDELITSIWQKTKVQQSTLAQRVKLLRQSLKQHGCDEACIALVRGEGYRFNQEVSVNSDKIANTQFTTPAEKRLNRPKLPMVFMALVMTTFFGYFYLNHYVVDAKPVAHDSKALNNRIQLTVLPFKIIGNTQHHQRLSTSFTHELTNTIAMVRNLKVVTQESTSYVNTPSSLPTHHLVVGQINSNEEELTVNVQLLGAKEGDIIWGQTYQTDADQLSAVKFHIARDIRRVLIPSLLAKFNVQKQPDLLNPKAYDLYLKGLDYYQRNTLNDNKIALKLVESAYQMSPSCPEIVTGMGKIINRAYALNKGRLQGKSADVYAQKAITLDANYSVGYSVLAMQQMLDNNLLDAEKNLMIALSLNAEDTYALNTAARLYTKQKRFLQAQQAIEKLSILMPGSTLPALLNAELLFSKQQLTESKERFNNVLHVEPDNVMAKQGLLKVSRAIQQ